MSRYEKAWAVMLFVFIVGCVAVALWDWSQWLP